MATLSAHDQAILNCVFNPNLPLEEAYNEVLNETIQDIEDNTPETERTKSMEIEAVKIAENGKFDEALEILNKAILIAPNRASLYNNRAQVFQLKNQPHDAFADLSKAIELGTDKQIRTLCQAYCQRGLLQRKFDRPELAKDDFNEAAKLGSLFAKNQLVELNPYAALCNQMLRTVMETLK